MLIIHGHHHAIDYYREHGKGNRTHVYSELVDDQGFVLVHAPDRRETWLASYARACAEDFLGRVCAESGMWLVCVHRLLDDERRHVVTIRMRWPQATSAAAAAS